MIMIMIQIDHISRNNHFRNCSSFYQVLQKSYSLLLSYPNYSMCTATLLLLTIYQNARCHSTGGRFTILALDPSRVDYCQTSIV